MFEISLKKVVLGTAVVGGLALAGYYGYKWITAEEDPRDETPLDEGCDKDDEMTLHEDGSSNQATKTNVTSSPDTATVEQAKAVETTTGETVKTVAVDKPSQADDKTTETGKTTCSQMDREAEGPQVSSQCTAEETSGRKTAEKVSGQATKSLKTVAADQANQGAAVQAEPPTAEAPQDKPLGGVDVSPAAKDGLSSGAEVNAGEVVPENEGATGGVACEMDDTRGHVREIVKIADLVGGQWGSRIRNETYLPPFLHNIDTLGALNDTMEALCVFLFKISHTREELEEVRRETGWVYDFAYSYLDRVPDKVSELKDDTELVTFANDGTPMEKID